ncbi:hypothetical protein GCM10010435_94710 [Winogradskya consettensis]|uniref:STAS domain-containing protein n=1 Tax=Winogradskya consettensis TaxID=113560 RepID=A0A919SVW0_9ACTN|nr:STAS domain-containing protein [Actinoplanes consettensis]GIM79830.1 hypothetical protein Aco04nite_67510 [Actinoplanes consettensis]
MMTLRCTPFTVTYSEFPSRLRLAGELDMQTLPVLDRALEELLDAAGHGWIDLTGLTFMDVGGMRALALAARAMREARRELHLTGAAPNLHTMARILGWSHIFQQ